MEAVEAKPASEAIEASSEQRVTLQDDSFEAVFTNRGGSLVSLQLKDHSAASGEAVDLVRQRQGYPLPLAITSRQGGDDPLNEALFAVERSGRPAGPRGDLPLRRTGG